MTSPVPVPVDPDEQLARLRTLLTSATQHLLGSTIAVADPDWGAPSRGLGRDMAGVVIVDDSHGAHGIGLGWGLS